MNELKINRIIIFIITFLFMASISNANLVLELDNVVPGDLFVKVDATKYPILHVRIKATSDGIPANLQSANILIFQNHRTTKPFKTESFGNEWYDVYWYSVIEGTIRIICVYNNESSIISAPDNMNMMPILNIRQFDDVENPEMYFGNILPGDSSKLRVNVYALIGDHDSTGRELTLRVDSIKTYKKEFKSEWIGSIRSKAPPPVDLLPAFRYKVDLTYYPEKQGYIRDKFKVYYKSGLVEQVNLIGGTFNIPKANYIEVVQPNGGELLTPCQMYLIKWKRYSPGIITNIELSTNDGESWSLIGTSTDSTFEWTVPNIATDKARIRIKQDLTYTKPILLTKDVIPTYRIAHSFNGYKLLDANLAGVVREWDLRDYSEKGVYKIDNISYPGQKIFPLGVDYIEGDSKFAVAYRYLNQNQDYIAFFDSGNYVPVKIVQIETGFNTKDMRVDHNKNYMAFVSQFSNRILIHSAKDGSLIRELDFSYPVTSLAFNREKDIVAVALYNGEVQLISTNDFSVINKFDFSDIPIILEIGLSPDGKFIAVACMAPRNTKYMSNRNEVHVFDIPTKQIVRTFRTTASDPVGVEFNPVSTTLLIGSSAQPQLSLWDLTNDKANTNMVGSLGTITHLSFSPVGASVATASNSSEHLWIRNFSYPEEDSSDNNFSIIFPVLQSNTLHTKNEYIATNNDYTFNSSLCNVGIVPILIDTAYLKYGSNFRLKKKYSGDSLYPGECIGLDLVFSPRDTGRIYDSVVFSSCLGEYYAPIEGYGMNRNIAFYFDTLDFGEVCLNYKVEKDTLVIRNEDPIPLVINTIKIIEYPSAFKVETYIRDDTLAPGESIKIKVSFSPTGIGVTSKTIEVFHSWLPKFTIKKAVLKGKGIGTIYSISHNDLRFIPEIPDRQIKIKNMSENQIYLQKADIVPAGAFTISNTFPVYLPPQGETNLDVHWNGQTASDVKLVIEAGPCVSIKENYIGIYSGSSLLSISTVKADPRGEAVIPINFVNTENKPYKGDRPFETEFTANPRMFLPQSVTSDYGDAELVRNEIINDRRIIGVRVNGDYDLRGVVAEVHGIAGLAETDTSKIEFINTSSFWGKAVNVNFVNGDFTLINLCGTRRFLQNSNISFSISPNPAYDDIDVDVESDTNSNINIDVIDYLGYKVENLFSGDVQKGVNKLRLNLAGIGIGSYYIQIQSAGSQLIQPFIIVR
ncbi:MAG: hypothetical protein A2X61_12190 [Ignavibacteria bacterium GWB2_35_12]|nr:MAG: hypothetical protein A2X61_12190 [Ignavibacteria bacterium GWB2_35_12]OGU94803.1 MAG: hypothetical protein A2220_11420 [Ignavibacteria bacterium RIFOXYA2_FULL_35_10]OGV19109.1 MAG: hypothetical protein A2475_00985 [Ignavibacteria bacterium RIFOXYC2_FULL_35_21]